MEVEEAILHHPEAEQAGVIGVPDETRGEEIRELVRERLAEYEYPQHVEFVEELPTTTTGKIRRRSLREREE